MKRATGRGSIELKVGDIAREAADAVVNAANSHLAGGGGVDGAIHRAAGPSVMRETDRLYPDGCPTGSAVASTAGQLPCRVLIHAVGPIWRGGTQGEPAQLRGAVRRSLELAAEHECRSVAVPALSCGAYGYPVPLAAREILGEVASFLDETETPLEVRIVLFDAATLAVFESALEKGMS